MDVITALASQNRLLAVRPTRIPRLFLAFVTVLDIDLAGDCALPCADVIQDLGNCVRVYANLRHLGGGCPPKIVDAKVSYADHSAGAVKPFRRRVSVERCEFILIDAPGFSDDTTARIAAVSDLVVLPAMPSTDDLRPTLSLAP